MKKQVATVNCPKAMVGRVIGKNGETIRALQNYTGAQIQIDQTSDPMKVTISGSQDSLNLAISMVSDIVNGNFKGFAMLRQMATESAPSENVACPPMYAPGYGLIPPSQMYSGQLDTLAPSTPAPTQMLTDTKFENFSALLPSLQTAGKTTEDGTPSSFILQMANGGGMTQMTPQAASAAMHAVSSALTFARGGSVQPLAMNITPYSNSDQATLASMSLLNASASAAAGDGNGNGLTAQNFAESVSPVGTSTGLSLGANLGFLGNTATATSNAAVTGGLNILSSSESLSPTFLKTTNHNSTNLNLTALKHSGSSFAGSACPDLSSGWPLNTNLTSNDIIGVGNSNNSVNGGASGPFTSMGGLNLDYLQSSSLTSSGQINGKIPSTSTVEQDATQLHRLSDYHLNTSSKVDNFSDTSDTTIEKTSQVQTPLSFAANSNLFATNVNFNNMSNVNGGSTVDSNTVLMLADPNGRPFAVNLKTKESQWMNPFTEPATNAFLFNGSNNDILAASICPQALLSE